MTIASLRKNLNSKSYVQLKAYCTRFFGSKHALIEELNSMGIDVNDSMTFLEVCEEYKEEIIDYICELYIDA